MNKWIKLIICIFICQLAGIIGTLLSPPIPDFYASLNKPFFAPPNWLFGPVWITLYTLMGISLYLILNKKAKGMPLYVFGLQLLLNAIWTPIFFGLKDFTLAFVEIIILWFAILANIIVFYKIEKRAGLILIPYIIWVTIATFLTYYVMVLNGCVSCV